MHSYSTAVSTLHELRKSGERKPDLVVSLGQTLIDGGLTRKLGDEAWSVYEQIFIAALDVGRDDLAKTCLERLEKRFPDSPRVELLLGMKYEAEKKLDQALSIYEKILNEDETNMPVEKRKIALYKTMGHNQEAINALVRFLDVYYNDVEAWLELASLYLSQHLYQQAAFCLEELILLQPQNHFYHLKYAEVLYTSDNIPLALKEYCRVIELCDDYVRALYGIKLCTYKLLNASSSASSSKITGNTDSHTLSVLNELATERLLHVYSHKKGSKVIKDVVREWLQNY